MIPPKRFDIFPPDWGMLRRSRRVLIFLSALTLNRHAGGTPKERQKRTMYCVCVCVFSVFVCVCVCVIIKLHITAQSGPVILVILCHSH